MYFTCQIHKNVCLKNKENIGYFPKHTERSFTLLPTYRALAHLLRSEYPLEIHLKQR